jgi:hypothetical protein
MKPVNIHYCSFIAKKIKKLSRKLQMQGAPEADTTVSSEADYAHMVCTGPE